MDEKFNETKFNLLNLNSIVEVSSDSDFSSDEGTTSDDSNNVPRGFFGVDIGQKIISENEVRINFSEKIGSSFVGENIKTVLGKDYYGNIDQIQDERQSILHGYNNTNRTTSTSQLLPDTYLHTPNDRFLNKEKINPIDIVHFEKNENIGELNSETRHNLLDRFNVGNIVPREKVLNLNLDIKGKEFEIYSSESEDEELVEAVNVNVSYDDISQNVPDRVNKDLVKYLMENFSKRVCRKFILDQKDTKQELCCCGHLDYQHNSAVTAILEKTHSNSKQVSNSINPNSIGNQKPWNMTKHTMLFPTDAFGEIFFGEKINAKYVRLDINTEVSELEELLTKKWKIEKPKLIISMKGGEENYEFGMEKRVVFWEGLTKTAVSTNAWIITDGLNAGVAKEAGDAKTHHIERHGRKNEIHLIGFSAWGYVNSKEMLVNKSGYGLWPLYYITKPEDVKDNELLIEREHTHFVFFDNGTQHTRGYQKEIRLKLERRLSALDAMRKSSSFIVPIVTIVLEGNLTTLDDVARDIERSVPVILISGSGGMTDILSYAYNNCVVTELKGIDPCLKVHTKLVSIYKEETLVKVEEMIEKLYGCSNAGEYKEKVRNIVDNPCFLSVFRTEEIASEGDLDYVILKSILKTNQMKKFDQLNLAMLLDRVDVAREEIYTDSNQFETEDLNSLLLKALLEDNIDFVELLLENGLDISLFLNVKKLLELYNHPLTLQKNKHFSEIAKKHKYVSLKHVGKVIYNMTNETIHYLYLQEPYSHVDPAKYLRFHAELNSSKSKRFSLKSSNTTHKNSKTKTTIHKKEKKCEIIFDNPNKEIFLWCVLACKTEIALIFWQRCSDPMLLALLAQVISHELKNCESDWNRMDLYQQQIENFEKLAYEVLNECYEGDQRKATIMLMNPYKDLDNVTLLDLASQSNNQAFIKHFVVQKLLTNIWFGNIEISTSYIVILITCVLPFMAPFLLKYRKIDVNKMILTLNDSVCEEFESSEIQDETEEVEFENNDINVEEVESIQISKKSSKSPRRLVHQVSTKAKKEKYFFEYLKKIKIFFETPVIKFCYHCISHVCFLLLFSYIMLTQFYTQAQWYEYILTIWVGTLIVEEVRQLISGNTASLRLLLMTYLSNKWNQMDLVTILLYIIGFVLRLIPYEACPRCFYTGRIVLSLSLMFYCLRTLRFFSLHPELGPFLLMVQKTFNHALYFMAIVIIAVVAYGVALSVIQYPNHNFDYDSFVDLILNPWFAIKMAAYYPECRPSNMSLSMNLNPAETCAVEGLKPSKCYPRSENCRSNEWLGPIMAAFYVLFTNVLMLNLLIAMISDTYAEVSSKNAFVWSMQRYNLIREYHERPSLPHPFIIFEHIYLFYKRFSPDKEIPIDKKTKFDFVFSVNDIPYIVQHHLFEWERLQAEKHIKMLKIVKGEDQTNRLNQTVRNFKTLNMRLDKISNEGILTEDQPLYSKFDLSFNHQFPPRLYQRFFSFEQELGENNRMLQLLLSKFEKTTKSGKGNDKDSNRKDLSQMETEKTSKKKNLDSEIERSQMEFERELQLHMMCRRKLCYKNNTKKQVVFRVPVRDHHVPFEVYHPTYKPCTFTDPSVYTSLSGDGTNSLRNIEFNSNNNESGNRVSLVRRYEVVDGMPLNPMGRTGLCGRGVLGRWGPNRIHKAIFIRWEDRGRTGSLKRLQFLATIKSIEDDTFSIPSCINPAENQEVFLCLYPLIPNLDHEKAEEWLRHYETDIHQGYFDDERNTDNAWLEVVCKSYLEKTAIENINDFEFTFSETMPFTWKRISASLMAQDNDMFLLKRVAEIYGATF